MCLPICVQHVRLQLQVQGGGLERVPWADCSYTGRIMILNPVSCHIFDDGSLTELRSAAHHHWPSWAELRWHLPSCVTEMTLAYRSAGHCDILRRWLSRQRSTPPRGLPRLYCTAFRLPFPALPLSALSPRRSVIDRLHRTSPQFVSHMLIKASN